MKLCKHERQDLLCHLCRPDLHTYLAELPDGTHKRFIAPSSPGGTRAMDMGRRMGAEAIYKLVVGSQSEEARIKDPDEAVD